MSVWCEVQSQRDTKQAVIMGTFYFSKAQSPYFFTLTWVKKCSQYFYFTRVFLNMSICTSTWAKDVCTFAISENKSQLLLLFILFYFFHSCVYKGHPF